MTVKLVIDEKPISDPQYVKVGEDEYELREASVGAAQAYRDAQLSGITLGANSKPVKIEGMASSESLLVASCIYKISRDPETKEITGRQVVAEKTLKQWPTRIVKPMFEWIKEVSNLNESNNEIVDEIKKILELPESPLPYEDFVNYISTLSEDFEVLKLSFKHDSEERAKN